MSFFPRAYKACGLCHSHHNLSEALRYPRDSKDPDLTGYVECLRIRDAATFEVMGALEKASISAIGADESQRKDFADRALTACAECNYTPPKIRELMETEARNMHFRFIGSKRG